MKSVLQAQMRGTRNGRSGTWLVYHDRLVFVPDDGSPGEVTTDPKIIEHVLNGLEPGS